MQLTQISLLPPGLAPGKDNFIILLILKPSQIETSTYLSKLHLVLN